MNPEIKKALRALPSVDQTLRELASGELGKLPRWALVQAVQESIAALRQQVLGGQGPDLRVDPCRVKELAEGLLKPSLRPVINATGVVLHTNLGRAPLAPVALERLSAVSSGYSNLEYDLEARKRGHRHGHAAQILRELCGAEEALVVNNNAAAVLLCLAAHARGREVIVSRGELVEIGGSFRLPEVMAASGAQLKEVGATNRTHLRDYQGAIGSQTAMLLKVHRSNFAMVGFTAEISSEEMVALGREHGLVTMFDLGSGTLLDLGQWGLPQEPTVPQAVAKGFDLVTFSGDKLLGGPQAGIILGHKDAMAQVRNHPMLRAVRPDKLTLAALVATLEAYRDGNAQEQLPAVAMIAAAADVLRSRAEQVVELLRESVGEPWSFGLIEVDSRVGGGSLPEAAPKSWAVAVEHVELGADAIEALLRGGKPPVIARIEDERLLLDVRTVVEEQIETLVQAAQRALRRKVATP